jgi:CheY-like chemotaxis protein
MPLINRLGSTVRKLRQQLGLSQEQLAERADLHRTYIAGIERGGRNITLRSVDKLAKALNISVAALLTDPGVESTLAAGPANQTSDIIDILLVEDNADHAELTVNALAAGHLVNRIHIVHDGQQALDFLFATGDYNNRRGRQLPQLILLDLSLPKVSGIEVLERLKRDPRTQNLAVIVLTVSTDETDIAECKRLGVQHYIVKPVAFSDFNHALEQHNFHWALLKSDDAPSAN